uniref:SCP domain-containing protein n=1 Tax=Tetradesmus obliquus TaxID=3088 RepID=A0A383WET9_TETOB|eukprot:jgi/Sobl393_1/7066/SZX75682.1
MLPKLPLLVLLLCAAAAAAGAGDKGYDLLPRSAQHWLKPYQPPAVDISSTVQQAQTPAKFQQIVAAHNAYRAQHGAGPLAWDSSLAQSATIIALKCRFVHDPALTVGECRPAASCRQQLLRLQELPHVAGISSSNSSSKAAAAAAADHRYSEVENYNFNSPGFQFSAGHFTQVVWVDTTNIGCATTACNGNFYVDPSLLPPGSAIPRTAQLTVCHYNPAGNSGGSSDYRVNVLQRRAVPPPPPVEPPPSLSPPPGNPDGGDTGGGGGGNPDGGGTGGGGGTPTPTPSPTPPNPTPTPSPKPPNPTPTPSPAPGGQKFVGSTLAMGASITSGTCMLSQQQKYRLCINNFGEIAVMLNRTSSIVRWRTAVQLGQRGTSRNRFPYTLRLNEDYTITVTNAVGKQMMSIALPDDAGPVSLQLRDRDGKAVFLDSNGACLVAWGYGSRFPAGC